jgi:hypothetical protein
MDDTAVDRDAEIDMLVAMSGATRLQAARALDENQGIINSALTQLFRKKTDAEEEKSCQFYSQKRKAIFSTPSIR